MTPKLLLPVFALISMIALSGCQTRPADAPAPHFERAEDIDRWIIDARLGYRTADDGGSATVQWTQRPSDGHMSLSGPLGFGSATLEWKSGWAELTTSKGTFQARSPEELAWHLTGFWLPVSALTTWTRGLPWPYAPSETEYNEQGDLVSLNQLGWALTFDRYQQEAGVRLPHRIRGEQAENRFTFIIRDWQPGAE